MKSFLKNFENVRKTGENQYEALCPAHEDKHSSLSISSNENKILVHCHAGCSPEAIVAAVGLSKSDLFIKCPGYAVLNKDCTKREHIYVDEYGTQITKKVIFTNSEGGKNCYWYRFSEGNWKVGLDGLRVPLYKYRELLTSDAQTFYIVEGEKDVDTLTSMGYTATTAPNGAAAKWLPEIYNIPFMGKDVIVISDNDEPGEKHAHNVASGILSIANSIKIIPAIKLLNSLKKGGDFSDIVEELGQEEAQKRLDEAIETADDFKKKTPEYIRTDGNKKYVNASLLAKAFKHNEDYVLVRSDDLAASKFFFYEDGKYKVLSDDSVKALIKDYIVCYDESILKMSTVREVIEILRSDKDYISLDDFNKDENIINFRNGILDITTMDFKNHSPDYLSTIQLPVDWNNEETPTPIFDSFMNTLTNGDKDVYRLLLQIIGLCLSNVKGYRFKKALFLIGEGHTGKTQLKKLVERILGQENCSSLDLSDIEKRFGLSNLHSKRLAGCNDMGYMKVSELKFFKLLTGGDAIDIEKKHQDKFTATYNGFLWFCANQMPLFGGDRGEWVYDRMIIVNCPNVIPERDRDPFICDKMFDEKEGIVYKAIREFKKAFDKGYVLEIPEKCSTTLSKYKADNSPLITFYKECCAHRENHSIKKDDNCTATAIRKVFAEWCKQNCKGYVLSTKEFERELMEYLNEDIHVRVSHGRYYSFKLTMSAKEEFRNVYGNDNIY
ncbi:MAG: toprim domain-containing protein [Clostridia bacterium]|nr:toprim domain-containing protein [Clostridia bacterium]